MGERERNRVAVFEGPGRTKSRGEGVVLRTWIVAGETLGLVPDPSAFAITQRDFKPSDQVNIFRADPVFRNRYADLAPVLAQGKFQLHRAE